MNHLDKEVLDTLKQKLVVEKDVLVRELSTIAVPDPENPANWQPLGNDINKESADPNKRADNIEEYEANTVVVNDLEIRLLHVNNALENIDSESYGVCTECKENIPMDRLVANAAASTCVGCTK